MKIRRSSLTLVLTHRNLTKLMDLPNKKPMLKELNKILTNFGKIELVKLSIKNPIKVQTNFGKIQQKKLRVKISNLAMSLSEHINLKSITQMKLQKCYSMISIKMTTCLQTLLFLMPK